MKFSAFWIFIFVFLHKHCFFVIFCVVFLPQLAIKYWKHRIRNEFSFVCCSIIVLRVEEKFSRNVNEYLKNDVGFVNILWDFGVVWRWLGLGGVFVNVNGEKFIVFYILRSFIVNLLLKYGKFSWKLDGKIHEKLEWSFVRILVSLRNYSELPRYYGLFFKKIPQFDCDILFIITYDS